MPEPGPYRLLVTGSRTWTNVPIIRCVLSAIHCDHPDAVLVSGHCPQGGDLIAEQEWAGLCGYGSVDEAIAAGRIEPHPLDGKRYGRAAGPVRNSMMVKLGADQCGSAVSAVAGPDGKEHLMLPDIGEWKTVREADSNGGPVLMRRDHELRTADPELSAIAAIIAALDGIDDGESAGQPHGPFWRVLAYLAARYGYELADTTARGE